MSSPLLGLSQGSLVGPLQSFFLDAPMDWRETPEAHVFDIDLPGLGKEDVKVQLVPGRRVLEISAERKEDEEDGGKGHKWHCRERTPSGGYSRQFRLPEDAKVDGIKASMREGVLTLVVPKDRDVQHVRKHRHKIKAVEISGDDKHHGGNGKDNKGGISRFVCCKV